TADQVVNSHPLYQLSYRGKFELILNKKIDLCQYFFISFPYTNRFSSQSGFQFLSPGLAFSSDLFIADSLYRIE
ncbi:MAG: hypothetical protein J7J52_05935, partial [Deltaproteobacteria bacterium]|nr:hypothetical protein [Deltaproteobacteria bacterium]